MGASSIRIRWHTWLGCGDNLERLLVRDIVFACFVQGMSVHAINGFAKIDKGFQPKCLALKTSKEVIVPSHDRWEQAADRRDQLLARFRFRNEVAIGEQASEHCGFFRGVMATDQDDLGVRSALAYLAGCLYAAHFRHHDI